MSLVSNRTVLWFRSVVDHRIDLGLRVSLHMPLAYTFYLLVRHSWTTGSSRGW